MGSVHDLRKRTKQLVWLWCVGMVALLAACSSGAGPIVGDPEPVVAVTMTPSDGATDVDPTTPVSVTASDGTLRDVALTNSDSGVVVAGTLAPDGHSYTAGEVLGYGQSYAWSGTAVAVNGDEVAVDGTFSTVAPDEVIGATLNIGDGQEVGVAAPIIVQFDGRVEDKAAVEKALVVTTNPPTEGAWAWLPDDNGGARAHWRPRQYWTPGTTVSLDARLYGLAYGNGAYGAEDLTLDFTIGRSQVVVANAQSHRMQVVRDGQIVMDIPVSYGEGNEPRNVTRSGIHVVTEKHEDFLMSNPPYYENVRERWAVRISNNGEFIHANPLTTGQQGASNVTNGCINLSMADAQEYFAIAMYGDPVEVSGTTIDLSEADGDLWDWAVDWPTWQSMSVL